jgi:hypothetical protein
MVLGFQLTKIPSNFGAVAAAPRKVSGGVGAPAAFDDPLVAGLTEGLTVEVLEPELRAATGGVPADWALVGDVLEMEPLIFVVVPLPGTAVAVLVPS